VEIVASYRRGGGAGNERRALGVDEDGVFDAAFDSSTHNSISFHMTTLCTSYVPSCIFAHANRFRHQCTFSHL